MTRIKSALKYDVRTKEMFFDRKSVQQAVDDVVYDALFWFGGRVREQTRKYIGKPKVAGRIVQIKSGKRKGEYRRQNYSKPRAAPRPPIARVDDSANVTLRNIQYKARLDRNGDHIGSVDIFGIKFARTSRFGRDRKSAPELHEFGGVVKRRAAYLKSKKGATKRVLINDKSLPFKQIKIPARPYLGPTFTKTVDEFLRRIARGQFGKSRGVTRARRS